MVKNRNWQNRVEIANERRREAKLRKSKSEDKRKFKGWVQQLLQKLTLHETYCSKKQQQCGSLLPVHVWADQVSNNINPEILDFFGNDRPTLSSEQQMRFDGRRHRSNSYQEDRQIRSNDKRMRSNSLNEKPTFREQKSEVWMCSGHFFTGKCEETNKKRVTSCLHYPSNTEMKTLNDVLQSSKHAEEAQRAISDSDGAPTGSTEMIYNLPVQLTYPSNDRVASFSDRLSEALCSANIGLSSVIYITIGGTLVFDRNREGSLLDEEIDGPELWALLSADTGSPRLVGRDQRSSSVSSESDEVDFRFLPSTTLEHILCFLPDQSVASACQVCKTWNQEIGQHSPALWKYLLERRNWPILMDGIDHDTSSPDILTTHYKETFLQHYSVWRDVTALQHGLSSLLQNNSSGSGGSTEYATFDFASRKGARSTDYVCVGIHDWAPHQALAVYAGDCSLHLFEATARGESASLSCRELICHRIDPYMNTKKRRCQLAASALDEEYIGCLGHVESVMNESSDSVLIFVSREDFLVGSCSSRPVGGEELSMKVIDIRQSIFDCLQNPQEYDNTNSTELVSSVMVYYLEAGGELSEVDVQAFGKLTSCGDGCFLVSVSICFPDLNSDGDLPSHVSMHKLLLFSARTGMILRMCHAHSFGNMSSFRKRHIDGTRDICTISVTASCFRTVNASPYIHTVNVHARAREIENNVIPFCPLPGNDVLEGKSWSAYRLSQVTAEFVVVADSYREIPEAQNDFASRYPLKEKVVVSFVPRATNNGEAASVDVLVIEGLRVTQLHHPRDEYIMMTCLENSPGNVEPSESFNMWAVLIHIPTRSEVGRQQWLPCQELPHSVVCMERTGAEGTTNMFCDLSGKGIVMTGTTIRGVLNRGADEKVFPGACSPTQKSTKRKKKKTPKLTGKKDSFTRGMSIRG